MKSFLVNWFKKLPVYKPPQPPQYIWVRVIRGTELIEVELPGLYNAELKWIKFDPPIKFRNYVSKWYVVADDGTGPKGYFWVLDEGNKEDREIADKVAKAMMTNTMPEGLQISFS